jgi:twitching motility protein PilT
MIKVDLSHLTLPAKFNQITDLYLPAQDPHFGLYYPGPDVIQKDNLLSEFAKTLITITEDIKPEAQFSLEIKHNGKKMYFRGHSILSIEGKVYVYRRLPTNIPRLEDLGFPKPLVDVLYHQRLNSGGLIIIAGETGQGKTTTAGSIILHRLKTYGSFCLTIEDPIELPLQGFHQNEDKDKSHIKGVCFQSDTSEDTLLQSIKSSLRCYPSINNSILFLGETRDAQMANEVLKAAANGHLVVTTFHGADIPNSIRRFLSLAASIPGTTEENTRLLFSSVFKLLIHQRLHVNPDGRKKIQPQILFSESHTSPVANRLKTGSIDQLSTEITQQNNNIRQGKAIIL